MAVSQNCHVIAIGGGKGGVGKSVFAANLACTFLNEMKAPTLLIDLDNKSCGDQNVIMGVRPQKSVRDLCNFGGALTPAALKGLISQHSSGLHFLPAVTSPDESLNAPLTNFKKQLAALSQHYRFIVVDLGSDFSDLQYAVIEECSALLLVTTPEVLVVNQTRKKVQQLMAATIPGNLMQIVINKASKNGLAPQAIGQSLKRAPLATIPQDDLTSFAALQGSTPFVLSAPQTPISASYHDLVRKLTGGIIQKLKASSRPKGLTTSQSTGSESDKPEGVAALLTKGSENQSKDPLTLLKLQIHTELIKEMDLKQDLIKTKGDKSKEELLKNKTRRVISSLTDKHGQGLSREERSRVITEVLDESLGLGPLEKLLADPTVTEIMVNGANNIYAEKSGKLSLTPVTFTSNLQLRNVILRIMEPLGRRIDEKTPYQDARLADGSRVNAVIEPLAIDGPALTIRKFPAERITVNDYTGRFNSLTKPMADFLKICVEQGLNIIISGGTGSGKTTLLNVISSFIPENERIVTCEDAAELQLKQKHVVRLETRPANMEGSGEISIRDLVRNCLRMRPDRIVVGECRDGAALDMLSAMNTGHDGSMTTVHSNSPREAISRLETLCMMAGMDLPAKAIREQIAGAVNLIIQISRLSDGSRKIISVTEVIGMHGEAITLQEIFRFKEKSFDKNRKIVGQFQAMGRIPTFIEKFEQRGITIPRNLFINNPDEPEAPNARKLSPTPMRPMRTTATKSPNKKKVGGDGGSK